MCELSAISLIIPSHRRGPKIGPTLESVYAQTVVPNEVIVVNDGGCPETSQYLQEHYPQVRLLNIDHGGAANARNQGAASARHETLMLLDDDDLLFPHAVETLHGLLTTFPEAVSAHADHTFTNHATGESIPNHHTCLQRFQAMRRLRPSREGGGGRLLGKTLYYLLLNGNVLQQPWMVRRSILLKVGGFRSDLIASDDWDLYMRITRRHPISISDVVISHHHQETERAHLTLDPRQRDGHCRAARAQLGHVACHAPWAFLGLLRTIGGLHKASGDQISTLRIKWRHYFLSMLHWPFDYVVVLRTIVLIPLAMLLSRKTHSTEATT